MPVVDLTTMLTDLYAMAEECRVRRAAALALADTFARHADYLESVATTLDGGVKP